jgi:hypothetical protein
VANCRTSSAVKVGKGREALAYPRAPWDNPGHYPFIGSDELGIGHELGPVLFGILGGIGGGVMSRLWKRQRESENRSP